MTLLGIVLACLCLAPAAHADLPPGATLKSASELDYPPFALVLPDGSPAGFTVDLLRAVAGAVQLQVSFEVGPWDVIKQELAQGKIDVLPFMSYSEERAKTFDFSVPYLRMHGTIFVRKGNTDIHDESDLKDKEVLVMRGDTAHEYAESNHLSDKLFLTDSYEEAMRLLSGGKHDAVIVQQVVGWQLIKKLGVTNLIDLAATSEQSLKISQKPLAGFEQKFCIAVKKGNAPLLAKLNEGLSIVSSNGVFDALYAKWFGPILPERSLDAKALLTRLAFILIPALLLMALAGVWYLRREVARKTHSLRMEITERLQAEERLRENKEQLQFVLEGSQLGYWDWDIRNGQVQRNEQWARMLGYDIKDIAVTADQWLDLIHPDDRAGAKRSIEDHLAGHSPMHKAEYRMLTKRGDYKWILDQAKVVEYDDAGAPARMSGTHADITEWKMAEIARRESDAKLKAALASMSDGVFITDAKGNITHSNLAFAKLCGFKDLAEALAEFAKSPDLFTVSLPNGEPAPVESCAIPRALRGETATKAEYFVQRKDTGAKWIGNYSFGPIYGVEGGIVGAVCSVRDITEDKNIERQLREAKDAAEIASKTKSEFLANMSHELRTPLNGVLGMLQLLQQTDQTGEQKEYVQTAFKATNRLTRLLGDILDISRIEAGKMQIVDMEFSTGSLRDSTVELFSPAAKEKGLEFTFTIAPETPFAVIGDETRVRQILFNLVGNAVKFTQQGGVHIAMDRLADDGDKTRILFTVRDTGIGIPDECVRDIFEPFVQAEGSYARRFQGAGLGLSIVRRLVGLLGGELAIDSAPGEGTTMYLVLSFKLARHDSGLQAPRPHAPNAAAPARLRILIAEDDETSRLTGKRMLEKMGYEAVLAEDGRKALERLAQEDFDLILMDVQMPSMDGMEATRAIRTSASLGARSRIPIVAMTAYAMPHDREKFLEGGMDDYVSKPVNMAELQEAILRATGKASWSVA